EETGVFNIIADYFLWFLRTCSGVFNLAVAALLIRERTLLQKPYYSLILIFNTSIVLLDGSMLYFTSFLVFLIGLNRLAIFSTGKFHDKFSQRKTILICAFISLVISLVAAVLSNEMLEDFFISSTAGVNNATSGIISEGEGGKHIETLFACLYLVTCGLFMMTTMKLKKQGATVISNDTRTLLGKAEKSMLRQSHFILACALTTPVLVSS
ncbi:hypothetical protein V3C99_007191, partial [Haemonchus contortus]